MSYIDWKGIDKKAEKLLLESFEVDSLTDIELPINLAKVLDTASLELTLTTLPEGVSGAFDRNANTIYCEANDSLERKSFTIAHELGHWKLHQDITEDILWRDENSSKGTETQEKEANRFAANLLMPAAKVKNLWKVHSNVEDLSRAFNVSTEAMFNRLKSLKIIG